MSTDGALVALQALLPNGTSRWVALLTTLPDVSGAGAVEVDAAGYARVGHDAWDDVVDGVSVYRHNLGTIELPELAGDALAVGWAVYDAAADGALVAWGELLDGSGEVVELELVAGDLVRFLEGDLEVRLDL